jgi:hypothetical protein
MPVQTTVTGEFVDSSGVAITNATVWFQPVSSLSLQPLSFRDGGDSVCIVPPVSALVTNGNFTIPLDDTTTTTPVNIGYSVTLIDHLQAWQRQEDVHAYLDERGCRSRGSDLPSQAHDWLLEPHIGSRCNTDHRKQFEGYLDCS